MSDRNALEDLLTVLKEVEGFPTIRDYWTTKWSKKAPWGACVVAGTETGVLAIHGEKGLGFPGGKPDPGESPLQCAARELSEETGYILELENLLHIGRSKPRTYYTVGEPIPTEKGVPVYPVFVPYIQCLDGRPRESREGFPCIVHPSFMVSARARFPEWNRKALAKLFER
jgi:8-oxo-dGTP pyrophosphatase MutT (NUDIX family)